MMTKKEDKMKAKVNDALSYLIEKNPDARKRFGLEKK